MAPITPAAMRSQMSRRVIFLSAGFLFDIGKFFPRSDVGTSINHARFATVMSSSVQPKPN